MANPSSISSRRRAGRWLLGVAALLLGLLIVTQGAALRRKAEAGAAFGARVGCSCRYVAGRPLAQCRTDFEPGMKLVFLSDDDETRTVTARVPLLARQSATWREGMGCALEPWRD